MAETGADLSAPEKKRRPSWLRPTSRQLVVDRWGGDERVLAQGFIPVPRLFLLWGASLLPKPLTPAEVLFIITLVGVKWSSRHPRLSYDTIAARTGLSAEYCRKIAKTLDRRGLVKRSRKQGDANHFDLTEVFRQLSDFQIDGDRRRPDSRDRHT
ncbi:MAG TPA: hypothetical protein VN706_18720 [Gemmatimonadaceae bacterium]|nr:hypothetical protein [Gemmatimonadaceae bacterium]